MQLEELLDWYIGPQLRTVRGVVEVNSFGGQNREYQVVLRPERLQSLGLSLGDVAAALEKSNANAGGGYIEHNQEHFVIGSEGLVTSREDLERVVVGATPQGVPITIGSLGEVRFGGKLRRGAATQDGEGEVVVGVAMMLMGENSRTVTEAIKDRSRSSNRASPRAPASSRSTTARCSSTARSTPSPSTCSRAPASSSSCCCCCSATCAPASSSPPPSRWRCCSRSSS
jgi:cobalt-zinc-cadmium resistance protein CzcA